MNNSDKIKIIAFHNNKLNLDCPCVHRSNDTLEIHDQSRMPKDEIELKQWQDEMIADSRSSEYLKNRIYPSTGDQLDYIYHNGIASWKTWIKETVKDKWPKP